jgi:hypothetical protein
MNGMIVEVACCMFHHGRIMVKYWAKVMNIAIYVQARCPHKAIPNVTLKKLWNGRKPIVKLFKNSCICIKTRANM